ncbi:MAG: transcription-repair coupling factor [Lachnospiraceae bacterium]
MNNLMAPLRELAGFSEMKEVLEKKKGKLALYGCIDSQKVHMMQGLSDGFRYKIIVTFSDIRVRELYEDLKSYDRNILIYPGKDLIFYQADIHSNELIEERIKVYRRIIEQKPTTIITTFDSLMAPQINLMHFEQSILKLNKTTSYSTDQFSKLLVSMGYEKNYQVEKKGQFSIRGGIIDIFDLTEENPIRIELWGDEIDSIRSFDILSQRSIEVLHSISIYPASELILDRSRLNMGMDKIVEEEKKVYDALRKEMKTEAAAHIHKTIHELKEDIFEFQSFLNLDSYIKYFYDDTVSFLQNFTERNTCVILDEPVRIQEYAKMVEWEFRESMTHRLEKGYVLPMQIELLITVQQVIHLIDQFPVLEIGFMEQKKIVSSFDKKATIEAKNVSGFQNNFELLVKELKKYKKEGFRTILLSNSRTRAMRLAKDLLEEGLNSFYTDDPFREVMPREVMVCYGHVRQGFIYTNLSFAVISEGDIFGREKRRKKKKKTYSGSKIQDFAELKVGDYVVHENHGLGIYKGIEKVQVEKIEKDYIKIQYAGEGNLYILATGLDLIQKYSSGDGRKPKLNKLGTKEWEKTKTKAKGAVQEIAKDLVALYATRQEKEGFVFGKDTVWQKEFEEMFPFEETNDQLEAILATKSDMESKKIMDRLICGDVGYGKTEIAIRAAFKAVQDGKQVVFLVPTTILAQQHYNNFINRMKEFPIRIDLMCRFRSLKEQKTTVTDLKKGLVDIVIGTHRILSKDMEFKDLGLLIVDEEQRFGVTHKEKIKKLKDDVDVLTLSATPIPRTLHMSLVGIRDMSVLEEAPNERQPIQTYVAEYNEELIREAIVRELNRGGQIYYVYNRVNNIEQISKMLQELVPDAVVSFAHGQMNERELERIMYEFVDGAIDVLVSTTIIETGLDISNVNTIIIHDSDQLGLSQLYQLRGRVGRSNRMAYAFLMYKRDKVLKEIAEKRLQAIKEFTDLGSGFKIAMRDLEIRGAGNLLGSKQHGHMEAIGYDLYCKMLNDAVKNLKGLATGLEDFNTLVDLDVDAFIPPSFIMNEIQKLDIYKRIAAIESKAESEEMKDELLDRFGSIPKSVENLMRIALIRVSAHKLYITEIKGKNETITFLLKKDGKIFGEKIPALLKNHTKLKFNVKGTPSFTYSYKKFGMVEKDSEFLLSITETLLEDMKIIIEE